MLKCAIAKTYLKLIVLSFVLTLTVSSIGWTQSTGPVIVLSTESISTGTSVGQFIDESFTITNAGESDLSVEFLAMQDESFTVLDPPDAVITISGGAGRTVTVRFEPLSTGVVNATLSMLTNDPARQTVSVALQGTAAGAIGGPVINTTVTFPLLPDNAGRFENGVVQYDVVELSSSLDATIELENTGDADLDVVSISISGTNLEDFEIISGDASDFIVPPGASHFVVVRFAPTTAGQRNGALDITSNAILNEFFSLPLQGTGKSIAPDIKVDPVSLDFLSVNTGEQSDALFVIRNTGQQDLLVSAMDVVATNAATLPAEFELLNPVNDQPFALPLAVAQNTSQSVRVRFKPTIAGDKAAKVQISSNDPDEAVREVALTGEAVDSVEMVDLNIVVEGTGLDESSGAGTIEIVINGGAPITFFAEATNPSTLLQVQSTDVVTLRAIPGPRSGFADWMGDPVNTNSVLLVDLAEATSVMVTARFETKRIYFFTGNGLWSQEIRYEFELVPKNINSRWHIERTEDKPFPESEFGIGGAVEAARFTFSRWNTEIGQEVFIEAPVNRNENPKNGVIAVIGMGGSQRASHVDVVGRLGSTVYLWPNATGDFDRVAFHEIGHFLGFWDPEDSGGRDLFGHPTKPQPINPELDPLPPLKNDLTDPRSVWDMNAVNNGKLELLPHEKDVLDYLLETNSPQSVPQQYSVIPGAVGPGSVKIDGVESSQAVFFDPGTSVTIQAVPSSNDLFAGWHVESAPEISAQGENPSITLSMDGPKLAIAEFTFISTLTILPSVGGSATAVPLKNGYAPGEEVILTAAPGMEFGFDHWIIDGGQPVIENPTTIVFGNSDIVVEPIFSLNGPDMELDLIVGTSGSGNVNIDPPGGTYTEGTSITLTATPTPGNVFTGWTGDLTGSANPLTFTIHSNTAVTAHLAPESGGGGEFTRLEAESMTLNGYDVEQQDGSYSGSQGIMVPSGTGRAHATVAIGGTYDVLVRYEDETDGPSHIEVRIGGTLVDSWDLNLNSGVLVTRTVATSLIVGSGTVIEITGNRDGGERSRIDYLELIPVGGGTPSFALNAGTVGSGSVSLEPPGGSYESGTNVTLTASPDPGFVFSAWSGDLSGTANPETLTMDGNKNVTATFTPIPPSQFALTVTTNGSGSVDLSPAGGTYDTGSVVTLTAIPASGFIFSVWSGDLQGSTNPASLTMDAAKNATATFTAQAPNQFSLTVNTSGQGTVALSPPGGVYDSGTAVTLTATANAGNSFSAWSGDVVGSLNPVIVNMDGNKSVVATFIPDAGGGGNITLEESVSGVSSGSTTVSTTGNVASVSGNVYLAAVSSKSYKSVASVSGLDLTWSEVAIQCSGRNNTGVSIWLGQGTSGASESVTATFNASPTNAVILVSRYSGVSTSNPVGSIVSGNSNGVDGACSGGTDSDSYSLSFSAGSGSTVFGAGALRNRTHTQGAGFTARGDIAEGAGGDVAGLSIFDQSIGTAGVVSVNGSFSSSVDWAVVAVELRPGSGGGASQFTLSTTVSGSGNVTLSPPGGTYDSGTAVTMTASPDPGFIFSGWSGDLTGNTNPASIIVDGNKNIVATFSAQPPSQFSINVTTTGDGTVAFNPPGGSYEGGAQVILTATPGPGQLFGGWSGDLTGTANPDTIIVDTDKNVTATFVVAPPNQFTVAVSTVGAGSIDLSPPGGTYDSGTQVILSATPEAGNLFSSWSGDLTGNTNPDTLVIDNDKNVTATFISETGGGPVAFDGTANGTSSGVTTVTTSTNVVATSGNLYLAAVTSKAPKAVASISGMGLSWTLVRSQCSGRNATGVEVWLGQGTPTGSDIVTATFAAAPANAVIIVSAYSGFDPLDPIGTIVSGNTNGVSGACSGGTDSGAYSFDLSANGDGGALFGAVARRHRVHTPGSGFMEREEVQAGSGGDVAGVVVYDQLMAQAGSLVMQGSFSSDVDWALLDWKLDLQARRLLPP